MNIPHAPDATPATLPLRAANVALVLLGITVVWFANLGYRHLSDPDEGRYAEISREMVVSGDWVTPTLNGFRYFEKPPLQYWATAVSFELFGTSAAVSRLYTTLLALATVAFVYWVGALVWNMRTGVIAAAVLLSSLMWIAIGHINTLDLGLGAWLTAAFGCFLVAQKVERRKTAWLLACWVSIALAVLSKGLVALILPGLTIFLYALTQRDFKLLGRIELLRGLVLLLMICAPWFLLVSKRNETFAYFFFIHEHFERYLTTVHRRVEPWWFFLPVFLLGSFPWTWSMLKSGWSEWRAEQHVAGFRPARFLVIYALAVIVFFSGSGSKLAPYITPMFPALALLAGHWLAQRSTAELRKVLLPSAVIATAIAALAAIAALVPLSAKLMQYAAYGRWFAAAALVLAAGIVGAHLCLRRSQPLGALMSLTLAGLLYGQLIVSGHDTLSERRSAYAIAQVIQPHLTDATRLYNVDQYLQSLPVYLQRTVQLVVYRGELDMGIGLDPSRWIATLEDFAADWRKPGAAIATIEPRMLPAVQALNLPMEVIHQDMQAVVIMKH